MLDIFSYPYYFLTPHTRVSQSLTRFDSHHVRTPFLSYKVGNPPGGTGEQPSFENVHSWRAHFGAWAINSSPLILSFDLSNASKLDAVWPFITNKEVLPLPSFPLFFFFFFFFFCFLFPSC
jgi:hypothetical protein